MFKTTPAQLDGNGVIERPEGTNRRDSFSLHRKQKRRTTLPPSENDSTSFGTLPVAQLHTTPPPLENDFTSLRVQPVVQYYTGYTGPLHREEDCNAAS